MQIVRKLALLCALGAASLAIAGSASAQLGDGDSGTIRYGDACTAGEYGMYAYDPDGTRLQCNGSFWDYPY